MYFFRIFPLLIIVLIFNISIKSCTGSRDVEYHHAQRVKSQTNDTVYYYVDKRAQFPGGEDELGKFIAKNLKYPQHARKEKIEGRVIVQFIIEPDGQVSHTKVLNKGVHEDLQKEAERIVSMFPPWTPAMHNDSSVRVYVTLPITFRLD